MKQEYPDQSDAPAFIAAMRENLLKAAKKPPRVYYPEYSTPISVSRWAIACMPEVLRDDGITHEQVKIFTNRFEGKSCSMHQPLKTETRQDIMESLLGDLKSNREVFSGLNIPVELNDLMWFTIYNGRVRDFQGLPKEYVKELVVNSPILAQENLSDTKASIQRHLELCKNPKSKLAPFDEKVELIKFAVLHYGDPVMYLQKVLNKELEPPNPYADPNRLDVGSVVDIFRKRQSLSNLMVGELAKLQYNTLRDVKKAVEELFTPKPEDEQMAAELIDVGMTKELFTKQMGRFELLYQRVLGQELKDQLRPYVMKHIASDFLTNCKSFAGPISKPLLQKVFSRTVNRGVAENSDEYCTMRRSPTSGHVPKSGKKAEIPLPR